MVRDRGRRKEGKMESRVGREKSDKEVVVRKICVVYVGNGKGVVLI